MPNYTALSPNNYVQESVSVTLSIKVDNVVENVPDYFLDEAEGFDFNGVNNIMPGTWVPVDFSINAGGDEGGGGGGILDSAMDMFGRNKKGGKKKGGKKGGRKPKGKLARLAKGGKGLLKGASKGLGAAARGLGGAARFIPGVGLAVAGVTAGIGAFNQFNKTDEFDLKEGEEASLGMKSASAAGGALSALTFGMADADKISQGIYGKTGNQTLDELKEKDPETVDNINKLKNQILYNLSLIHI